MRDEGVGVSVGGASNKGADGLRLCAGQEEQEQEQEGEEEWEGQLLLLRGPKGMPVPVHAVQVVKWKVLWEESASVDVNL